MQTLFENSANITNFSLLTSLTLITLCNAANNIISNLYKNFFVYTHFICLCYPVYTHLLLLRLLQPCMSSFSMHTLNLPVLLPVMQPLILTSPTTYIYHHSDYCNHACLTHDIHVFTHPRCSRSCNPPP